jgi:hypothetical protein
MKTNIENISRDNPFTVPENYFENFALRMADNVIKNEDKKHSLFSLFQLRPQYALISAACLVLFFVITLNIYNHPNSKKLSVNELRHNIEFSIISELDENELINQLEIANNCTLNKVDTLNNSQRDNSSHLIEYLSKEDVDLNSIEDAM